MRSEIGNLEWVLFISIIIVYEINSIEKNSKNDDNDHKHLTSERNSSPNFINVKVQTDEKLLFRNITKKKWWKHQWGQQKWHKMSNKIYSITETLQLTFMYW